MARNQLPKLIQQLEQSYCVEFTWGSFRSLNMQAFNRLHVLYRRNHGFASQVQWAGRNPESSESVQFGTYSNPLKGLSRVLNGVSDATVKSQRPG